MKQLATRNKHPVVVGLEPVCI